jgi:DNA-binding MarR family transcriptional regulator/ActR/RegA family two-component response regulator
MLENTQASPPNAQSNQAQGDEYIFAQEDEAVFFAEETKPNQHESWKILIVDDDAEVHEVTKLALSDVTFENKTLSFISAYSAAEAKQLIQAHPDTAILFLDVVMETEDAGLQVIPYIREELNNPIVRIILRTGQPGQAPENVVAVNYGIDDYKTKTELTSQKLFITVITALRAFSTLTQALEVSRMLEQELAQYRQTMQPSSTIYATSIIARIARMVLRMTDEHSAKLGISQNRLAVLLYLSTEPERCASPSALAKQCGVSRAAMTGLLDGLEQDEYVERDVHPSDRRALMIKLTPKGQEFLDWIAPQDQYPISELMDSLDEAERKTLTDLVTKAVKLFGETALALE